MAKFTGVCVLTEDVLRLAAFYGMALQVTFQGDETHAEVHTEGSSLAIFAVSGMDELAPGSIRERGRGGYLLEFQVPDVDMEYGRLVESGVSVVKPPTTYPWGRRAAWFRDPDGNLVNFYTVASGEQGAAERREAPSPRQIVRSYFQGLLNARDLSTCDRLLAADYVDHDAPTETPPGPENTRAFVRKFLADYPDLHVHIEDIVAEGDKVAVRMVWQGRHKDTGAPYHLAGIVILRVNDDGLIAERWSAYSPAS